MTSLQPSTWGIRGPGVRAMRPTPAEIGIVRGNWEEVAPRVDRLVDHLLWSIADHNPTLARMLEQLPLVDRRRRATLALDAIVRWCDEPARLGVPFQIWGQQLARGGLTIWHARALPMMVLAALDHALALRALGPEERAAWEAAVGIAVVATVEGVLLREVVTTGDHRSVPHYR